MIKPEKEQWAEIKGFPNYAISNLGRVKSLKYNKILAPKESSYGYQRVTLYRNSEPYERYVHQLVADAFISGYNPGYRIRHENEDNTDNNVYNLRFAQTHRMGNLIRDPPKPLMRIIKVVGTDLSFETAEECASYFGAPIHSIYRALRGGRATYDGHALEYREVYGD